MEGNSLPKDWLGGIAQSWRVDLIAAFSVALVALPLALGIALASNVPPMAGALSVVIGGMVTTLIRSGHVGINGPTPGLINALWDFNKTLWAPNPHSENH